jgi:hypothetical protein
MRRRQVLGILSHAALAAFASLSGSCIDFDSLGQLYMRDGGPDDLATPRPCNYMTNVYCRYPYSSYNCSPYRHPYCEIDERRRHLRRAQRQSGVLALFERLTDFRGV